MKKMLMGAIALALTACSTAPTTPIVPKALQNAVANGMKIEKSFPAVGDLTGWVVSDHNQPAIVYSTKDGKYLIIGALVDGNNKNWTKEYAETKIDKPDVSKQWGQLEKSSYFVEGAKNPKVIVYAFEDANCIFCHLLWKAVQPYEKVGLQMRVIPVAFLKPDSLGKDAAILTAKDPAAAMYQNETKFDLQHEEGGIPALAKVPADVAAKIKANGDLMNAMGFGGTPAMVYKDASGKVLTKPGMVRLSELPKMLGLPAQPNNDPALARFQ